MYIHTYKYSCFHTYILKTTFHVSHIHTYIALCVQTHVLSFSPVRCTYIHTYAHTNVHTYIGNYICTALSPFMKHVQYVCAQRYAQVHTHILHSSNNRGLWMCVYIHAYIWIYMSLTWMDVYPCMDACTMHVRICIPVCMYRYMYTCVCVKALDMADQRTNIRHEHISFYLNLHSYLSTSIYSYWAHFY